MSLLADEIDEIGRRLAQRISPGSPVAKARRSKIRALLREAFRLTQADRPDPEDSSDDAATPEVESDAAQRLALQDILQRLRAAAWELEEAHPGPLASRMNERRRFGAIDQPLVDRNANFSTVGLRCAEGWSDVLDERIERTLATLGEVPEEDDEGGMVRPIRTQEEARELILSKLE